jgi:phenylalanyl-tRNA synthetase beta chain
VYLPRPGAPLPSEPTRLAIVSGLDYLGLKGVIEALLARLHAEGVLTAQPATLPLFAPGRAAELRLGETHLGYVGEVDRARLDALDIRGACSAAELSFDLLQDRTELVPRYRPLPPFPAVARDLSLVVPQSLPWAELARVVQDAAGATLESLAYLDTFRGGSVPDGYQSVHFGLRFRHPERTLTGDEADAAVKTIVAACAQAFRATLRT